MTAERFDEDYFRAHYSDYELQNPPAKLKWYERAVRGWTDSRPIRLLDIGCGLGSFAGHMSGDTDVVVHATDVSEFAISSNRARFPGVTWEVASATAAPWPESSFDVVTAFDVLEHLNDPSRALIAASQMLTKEGTFIAVVPVYDGPSGPFIRRLDRDPTHVNRWTRNRWLQLVAEHFNVVEWSGAFRYRLPLGPYIHVPSRLFRRATPAVMIVGRQR